MYSLHLLLECMMLGLDDHQILRFYIKNFLWINSITCTTSAFDDNPEITAYIQVKDVTNKNNDEVFIFTGWTFSSSPAVNPFDHPVYDIWLTKCY